MGLNSTPTGQRAHIGIFGCRNAGKSSVINAITSQDLAIVSPVLGTTTDPVYKSMELLPLGPVTIIDTPGLDDAGDLGELRVAKARQVLRKTDIAVLVVDSVKGLGEYDKDILAQIKAEKIPYIIAMNKADMLPSLPQSCEADTIFISTTSNLHIHELKELIASKSVAESHSFPIIADMLTPGSLVVLVVPVDSAAPKGRLILPQQQTIREILDHNSLALVVQEDSLAPALARFAEPPRLVVTDSQAFARVSAVVPESVPLTSFSILFARHKGELYAMAEGAKAIDNLRDNDRVLISEGCTHHRQCEDIGTVKLPNWLRRHTNKELTFDFTSGTEFPLDLAPYKLIIHCGACTLNRREVRYRLGQAAAAGVPMTNYGIAISYLQGILPRCMSAFELCQ